MNNLIITFTLQHYIPLYNQLQNNCKDFLHSINHLKNFYSIRNYLNFSKENDFRFVFVKIL